MCLCMCKSSMKYSRFAFKKRFFNSFFKDFQIFLSTDKQAFGVVCYILSYVVLNDIKNRLKQRDSRRKQDTCCLSSILWVKRKRTWYFYAFSFCNVSATISSDHQHKFFYWEDGLYYNSVNVYNLFLFCFIIGDF